MSEILVIPNITTKITTTAAIILLISNESMIFNYYPRITCLTKKKLNLNLIIASERRIILSL